MDAAVGLFHGKIRANFLLAPFFGSVDLAGQIARQKAFLTTVCGGPNAYNGDLRASGARMEVPTWRDARLVRIGRRHSPQGPNLAG